MPMMELVNVAIIYYSATGTVHALAHAAAEEAEKVGAQVRLRKVTETAPPEAINANPAWAHHLRDTADVAGASLDDLAWADAVLFGSPTRFGNPASQLRAFIDTTGPMWQEGKLADKVYSAFTASGTAHGGQESTILALGNTFYHWGGIIVPPRLYRPHPVPVRQSLRDLPRGRRRPTRRRGLGSGPLPGPARRRHHGRAQGRPRRLITCGRPSARYMRPRNTARRTALLECFCLVHHMLDISVPPDAGRVA
jgi:NAD(P)H dehydrogenase (quinone)